MARQSLQPLKYWEIPRFALHGANPSAALRLVKALCCMKSQIILLLLVGLLA
jgi:hypothetical protein